LGGTVVEAEYLFGYIPIKMKRFHSNVSTARSPLKEAPKFSIP
jgi:hypothetical protein